MDKAISREQRDRAYSRSGTPWDPSSLPPEADYDPNYSYLDKHIRHINLSHGFTGKGQRAPDPTRVADRADVMYDPKYTAIDSRLHGAVRLGIPRLHDTKPMERPVISSCGKVVLTEGINGSTKVCEQALAVRSRHVATPIIGKEVTRETRWKVTSGGSGSGALLNSHLASLTPKYDSIGGFGPAANSNQCTRPCSISRTGRKELEVHESLMRARRSSPPLGGGGRTTTTSPSKSAAAGPAGKTMTPGRNGDTSGGGGGGSSGNRNDSPPAAAAAAASAPMTTMTIMRTPSGIPVVIPIDPQLKPSRYAASLRMKIHEPGDLTKSFDHTRRTLGKVLSGNRLGGTTYRPELWVKSRSSSSASSRRTRPNSSSGPQRSF